MRKGQKVSEIDVALVLQKFNQLQRAVIDACSIIYLDRLSLLNRLSAEIKFITTLDVWMETRLSQQTDISLRASKNHLPADDQLILLARSEKLPVVSDDGQVLKKAANCGLDYFNSLMMLLFLLHKNKISQEEFLFKKEQLISFAYYAPWIVESAKLLETAITKSNHF